MSSNARSFFAGLGTTFVILAVGFGGGLMMASSTLQDPTGRVPSVSERLAPVRIILPASAEPAQPRQPAQPTTTAIPAPESQPQAQQKTVQPPVEEEVEKPTTRRAEERERRRRSAERKAKKLAIARAQQQLLEQQSGERKPGIMAFGANEQPRLSGFFGN
jgi:outer membrane biosynthesis protein TonB